MADMDELMNAEFKEAFDEFDKVIYISQQVLQGSMVDLQNITDA